MNEIVVPEFLGRLANNQFQVAAAMNYSQKYDVPWAILPSYHHRQIYKYFKSPIFKGNHRNLTTYDAATNELWAYHELPNVGRQVKLRGFFQSYRYLDPVKDQFIKWLNFREYPDLYDFTSIHIRRTDYVTHADNFGSVTLDYVRKAINTLSETKGRHPEKFIVFSDEINWCKENFAHEFPDLTFIFSEGKNEYEELSKMSSCANNIIANSTFSYIAAYANPNPEKVVISPSENDWFGPKSTINVRDLLPKEWTQINFR
jgi:hypothetical protein